jgi:hypothetical protein
MACSHLTNRQQSVWGSLTLVALVWRLVEVPRYLATSANGNAYLVKEGARAYGPKPPRTEKQGPAGRGVPMKPPTP